MKAVITGAGGTVGSALVHYLQAQGIETVGWDRTAIALDDYQQMAHFLRATQPDVLFHLATASQPTGKANESWLVNYEWTSELAWLARQLDITFVFTSSVMVFTDDAKGPFTLESQPDVREGGYGYEKWMAEQRALAQNPQAKVVRLGWQIGEKAGSNNMIDFFVKQMAEQGEVRASSKWLPACSFIVDTVAMLYYIAQQLESGLFMINSNDRWNFFEIATAINHLHGNVWQVVATEDFVYDQRMLDPRLPTPLLSQRLTTLSAGSHSA